VEIDGIIGRNIPWRPHLMETAPLRGWYIHSEMPLSNSWVERIRIAKNKKPKRSIGVAANEALLSDGKFLRSCHELEAVILPFSLESDRLTVSDLAPSVEDHICQTRLKLSSTTSRDILDRSLARALNEPNKQRKGVLLELLIAALLSQVDGFEVDDIGIANRSQQMDVLVHNRNVGSALGLSPIVLAEAKNWTNPVDTKEYAHFVRKLQTRHGRSKLGYRVTTGRFTAGVYIERARDSSNELLVVLIDGKQLPLLWQGLKTITANFERSTILAAAGK
jgi:hypothetical protein